jgi:5'-3' exonuclease
MGIKDFGAFFDGRERPLDALRDLTIAVDASTEIHTSATIQGGPKKLTSKSGVPTTYLGIVINKLILRLKNKCRPIYVFDFCGTKGGHHVPEKQKTVDERRKRRQKAKEKLETETDEEKKQSLECQLFTITDEVEEVKTMLDAFGVPWVVAPRGVEAEQFASWLNNAGVVDAVLSLDTDPVPFGANVSWRQTFKKDKVKGTNRKFFYEYRREDMIQQVGEKTGIEDPTIDDVRRICAMLGSDFSRRKRGVGPATLKKKYDQEMELDPELGQDRAFEIFSREGRIDPKKFKIPRFVGGIFQGLRRRRLNRYFDDLQERLQFNASQWKNRVKPLFGEQTREARIAERSKKIVESCSDESEEDKPKKRRKKKVVEFPSEGEESSDEELPRRRKKKN